jgi:hypothetical protein
LVPQASCRRKRQGPASRPESEQPPRFGAQQRRTHRLNGGHDENNRVYGRNTDASDNGSWLPKRYGQNECELALGRKNHLFAGSDGGADRWAIVASLLATAKLNGIEPYAYLKNVLERMTHGYPANRIDDLLPWNWIASNVET